MTRESQKSTTSLLSSSVGYLKGQMSDLQSVKSIKDLVSNLLHPQGHYKDSRGTSGRGPCFQRVCTKQHRYSRNFKYSETDRSHVSRKSLGPLSHLCSVWLRNILLDPSVQNQESLRFGPPSLFLTFVVKPLNIDL